MTNDDDDDEEMARDKARDERSRECRVEAETRRDATRRDATRRDVACVNLAQGSTPLLSPSCSTSNTERRADRSPLVRYVHIKCAGFAPLFPRSEDAHAPQRHPSARCPRAFTRVSGAASPRSSSASLLSPFSSCLIPPFDALYIHTSKHCIYTHTRICIMYITCVYIYIRLYARMYDMCTSSRRYSRSLVSSLGASSNRI